MSARCLLISVNRTVLPYPVYPIGIAHLTAALVAAGHSVLHVDLLADDGIDALRRVLSAAAFDMVGISIRNIDTVDSTMPDSLLADAVTAVDCVRELSSAPVVLGGPGFSIMPEELLDFLQADYGIIGEGEEALPQLVEDLSAHNEIPDRIRTGALDHYPRQRPVIDEKIAAYYVSHGGMLNIQTKRGCPHHCAYCSYPGIEGRCLRYKEPAEVAEEMDRLVRKHHARYIFFTDGVFNDRNGHFREVAEALIRADNTTPWCAFFRPSDLSRDDLQLMKRSGLKAMELGTDCATDTTLAALNKGFAFDDAVRLNDLAGQESLPCAHFIMFGGPGETESTVREGLRNIERLPGSVVFAYAGIRILPGTDLLLRAEEDGLVEPGQSMLEPIFYYSPAVSRASIEHQIKVSFGNRLDRLYSCREMELRIQSLHSLGHAGPMWDLLLPRTRRR